MSLAEYRGKRRFGRTPEPKGRNSKSPGRIFVIQQHGATRLHFDLRLELAGTMKSWAVPKGLALDPSEKRLAVHVEDQPIEYADFEGVIPEGEYGAGPVVVWDNGTWEPLGDAARDHEKGKLKFRLHGKKLTGTWMLVRMPRKEDENADNWLVIKERDETAAPLSQLDIVAERPESVLTGRKLAEDAASGVQSDKRRKQPQTGESILQQVRAVAKGRPIPLPATVEPALASLANRAPAGDDWLHEIKFDGYRFLAWLDHGEVKLRTRRGHDWTGRFPEIAAEVATLPANTALLDGEVVVLQPNGASTFSGIQQALSGRRTSQLVYYVFDGENWCHPTSITRRSAFRS
jgi:bifunctional non-homologous end joining protein LigD